MSKAVGIGSNGSTINSINNNQPNKGWWNMAVSVRSKGFAVMACAAAVMLLGTVSSASALDLSVGQYSFYASDFGGSVIHREVITNPNTNNQQISNHKYGSPWAGGGFGMFFDATYAEVGLGFTFAGGSPTVDIERSSGGDTSYTANGKNYSATFLNIGVLLKLPLSVGEKAKFYPAVGFDYLACIAGKPEYDFLGSGGDIGESGDYSQSWLKFGVGYDQDLSDNLFFRFQTLYGVGFESKGVDNVNESNGFFNKDGDPDMSHGLTIKLGLGFKL